MTDKSVPKPRNSPVGGSSESGIGDENRPLTQNQTNSTDEPLTDAAGEIYMPDEKGNLDIQHDSDQVQPAPRGDEDAA